MGPGPETDFDEEITTDVHELTDEQMRSLRAPEAGIEQKVTDILKAIQEDIFVIEVHLNVAVRTAKPLWQAHLGRARKDGDLVHLWMANQIVVALTNHPEHVAAVRARFGGKEWAVWIDVSARQLLAVLHPADLFLVGVG